MIGLAVNIGIVRSDYDMGDKARLFRARTRPIPLWRRRGKLEGNIGVAINAQLPILV